MPVILYLSLQAVYKAGEDRKTMMTELGQVYPPLLTAVPS